MAIPSQLERWNAALVKAEKKHDATLQNYATSRAAVKQLRKNVEAAKEAQTIAQTIAQDIQQRVHHRIAGVVTRCLEAVFEDDPYTFRIEFEQKRGRTEAAIFFERNGHELRDPMNESGGGCVDLAAIALRLSSMMLSRPPVRRVLILDEPFKSPSPHYRTKVRELIETLSEEMGVQIIMVTNILELSAGEVIDLD